MAVTAMCCCWRYGICENECFQYERGKILMPILYRSTFDFMKFLPGPIFHFSFFVFLLSTRVTGLINISVLLPALLR